MTRTRIAAVVLAGVAAGVLISTGIMWFALELDDGRHDLFGPELPAANYRVPPLQPRSVRPPAGATTSVRHYSRR